MRRVLIAGTALAISACVSRRPTTTPPPPAASTEPVRSDHRSVTLTDSLWAARFRALRESEVSLDSLSKAVRAQRAELERLRIQQLRKP